MTTLREAAQQALEALEALQGGCTDSNDGTVEAITVWCPEVIDDLRAALAEPVQEPVAWVYANHLQGLTLGLYGYVEIYSDESAGRVPLYTSPPRRKPLTEEEIYDEVKAADLDWHTGWSLDEDAPNRYITFARGIEAAYGIVEEK